MSGCNTDVTAGLEMTLGVSPPDIEVSGMQHPDLRPGARGQPLCPGLRDDDVLLVHQNIAPPAAGIDARLQRQHHARFEDHVFVGDQGRPLRQLQPQPVPEPARVRAVLAAGDDLIRDDSGYGLTGYGGYKFVTSYTILTVYYCNRSNLALFNRY